MPTLADQRKAIHDSMVAERTGAQVKSDINALVNPPRQGRALPALEAKGPIPARRGRGVYTPKASAGGTAAPFTEYQQDPGTGEGVVSREYFTGEDAVEYVYSTDYLLRVEIQPLKTLRMFDATGAMVQFNFNPPAEGEV